MSTNQQIPLTHKRFCSPEKGLLRGSLRVALAVSELQCVLAEEASTSVQVEHHLSRVDILDAAGHHREPLHEFPGGQRDQEA